MSSEPTDPGTDPSLVVNPLDGRPIEAQRFVFPDGVSGSADVGPLGARPGDFRPVEGVPLLGIATPIAVPRTLTIDTSLGTPVSIFPVDVVKPTIALLYRHDLVTADVGVNLLYFPGISFENYLDDNNGLKFRGPDLFFWAPGRWYVGAIVTSAVRKLTWLLLETENPSAFDYFREQSGCFVQQLSHTALAAATITTLVTLPDIVRCRRIVLFNVGANPVLWTYGNANPSATRGSLIPAGGSVTLEGSSLATQQIRGFSTAGSSIAVQREENPWIL